MSFSISTTVFVLTSALSLLIVWRTWRDPNNWRLDADDHRVVYNHWKELILAALIACSLLALTLFWVT